ncbi:uncharacterized protein PGRI_039610 [Penicillium griseofulvum]|uniref:Uncharacterized protein n=1 Tax=Penicillium patulum TaxID=5078 RepID=A0A135LCV1_PENPA|nr:uncharacterized protein PGRI_039610 [Penicillium griseofulvum]KXG46710.1 hypothetical protein PGRI_039610 [Penicillium griseofulvum]
MGVSTDKKPKDPPNKSEDNGESSSARPPSYSADQVEQPPLELPKLNLGAHLHTSSLTTVTRDECVAHLKLLAVLADLRDTISSDDGLFGINDAEAERFPNNLNEARARIREKRWAVYTARAVDRYTKWWSTGLPQSRQMATIEDLEDIRYENILTCDTRVGWSIENLPPLDILMVWHAHCLNPRNYLEDCIRYGKISTWATGFPWEVIDRCINNHTMEYTVAEEGQQLFEQKMNLKWNNLHDQPTKKVICPCCQRATSVPWTDAYFGASLFNAFKYGNGYADHSFKVECDGCQRIIDHERLKVEKFRKDVAATLYEGLPMPGSFINLYGIPTRPSPTLSNGRIIRYKLFPTRVVLAAGKELMEFTDARVGRCLNITQLKDRFGSSHILRDRNVLTFALGDSAGTIWPTEKVHIRRMMSRYWDNLGPFALDLVGAVIRQGTFVDKMDQIDWLHSPTVFNTMDRLIKKYEVFFKIMMENPKNMAVPTLDVDLAWHTHQLNPSRYYTYSTIRPTAGGVHVFIDHDDKVDEGKLSDGFAWTSKMYRRATGGGIYSECSCWYCEATRAPDLYDRMITVGSASRARTAADNLHDRPDISSDPNKNPHISSHNAVRPVYLYASERSKGLQRIRLQTDYQKAARRAEKRGRQRSNSKSANQNDAYLYMPYAYGYPIVMPYYAPYMMDPSINCESYASNPTCMNITPNAAGNCCSGTCGGGAAAGSCAGADLVAAAEDPAAVVEMAAAVAAAAVAEEEVVVVEEVEEAAVVEVAANSKNDC